MMNNLIDKVAKAKLILVPKGDDAKPCLQAFKAATGITVPEFEGRMLEVIANRQRFLKVKGRDIPSLIAAGYGDIGLTGTDSCEDYMATDDSVSYEPIGPKMCRFVLLSPIAQANAVRKQLKDGKSLLSVATSFPNLLRQCAINQKLNLAPTKIAVSGSVEIMPSLLGVPLVADLVSSGETAQVNSLVEVQSLLDICPAIVVKSAVISGPQKTISYSDIDQIDTVLRQRSMQVSNKSAQSYTLTLMRDVNKAGKKAGEEFAEVMMAILSDGDIADCESEIADLTYAQLVVAYSRNKPVKLANVMRILIERNQSGGPI